jgi:poly-gamma-glutamate capsule biosynthesis protein CapA/YwtB (metallophosphatase superfamily)
MKIFLCGDVMIGRGIDQILRHRVKPHLYEGYVKDARDYVKLAEVLNGKIPREVPADYIWGDALTIWNERKPDLKIINLETAITTNETFFNKGINYRMHPDNSYVLSAAEIDICALANNHILDWDSAGMKETISALDQIHIKHSGAGETIKDAAAPAIFEHDEGRVLVFSIGHISSGVPIEWNATDNQGGVFLLTAFNNESILKIKSMIEQYQHPGDVVIISIHWDSNWGYDVPKLHRQFAHALIDLAGVNIIHGHSSHHPRPIEIYKGRPIFYGCGDFINDYEGIGGHEEFRPELCLMYFIDIQTLPFKLQRLELDCLKINHFRLNQASDEDSDWMQKNMTKICQDFSLKFSRSNKNVISLLLD